MLLTIALKLASAHSHAVVRLCYPLLNPLSRWDVRVYARSARRASPRLASPPSLRLGVPLVATLGLEMGILGEKPQDLECAFCEYDYLASLKNLIGRSLLVRTRFYSSLFHSSPF
jgi:hypothetical protein